MSASTRSSVTRKSSLSKSSSTDKSTKSSPNSSKTPSTVSGNKQKMQYTKTRERMVDGKIPLYKYENYGSQSSINPNMSPSCDCIFNDMRACFNGILMYWPPTLMSKLRVSQIAFFELFSEQGKTFRKSVFLNPGSHACNFQNNRKALEEF